MKAVEVHEAFTNLSSLMAQVKQNYQSIVICRNGKSVADLVPHRRVSRTKTHPLLSKIKINYDPTEPAASDEWLESVK